MGKVMWIKTNVRLSEINDWNPLVNFNTPHITKGLHGIMVQLSLLRAPVNGRTQWNFRFPSSCLFVFFSLLFVPTVPVNFGDNKCIVNSVIYIFGIPSMYRHIPKQSEGICVGHHNRASSLDYIRDLRFVTDSLTISDFIWLCFFPVFYAIRFEAVFCCLHWFNFSMCVRGKVFVRQI